MSISTLHTRILSLPVPEPVSAGQLDSFLSEDRGRHTDLVLEYHALVPDDSSELLEQDGRIYERSRGIYLPRRLRFSGIERLEISGLYQDLDLLPPEHPARTIVDLYNWQGRGESLFFFLFFGRSTEDAEVRFFAHRVTREERTGEPVQFSHQHDWSSAPPMPARLVLDPKAIHQRFGGDPIDIFLAGKAVPRRLFVGGLDIQPQSHPRVDAVLNLGEEPSRWVIADQVPAGDRWVKMGEGSWGMSVGGIRSEAERVVEHLRSGQRVLIHCVAGMNRSVTIACAVLILLEGLTAEIALERVREHHPWARPDGHHWLALKWLASENLTPP